MRLEKWAEAKLQRDMVKQIQDGSEYGTDYIGLVAMIILWLLLWDGEQLVDSEQRNHSTWYIFNSSTLTDNFRIKIDGQRQEDLLGCCFGHLNKKWYEPRWKEWR